MSEPEELPPPPAAWKIGIPTGFVVAVLTATAMAARDWSGNPGGLFRDEAGTHWSVVWETWTSWFTPTAVAAMVVATISVVAWRRNRQEQS